MAYSAYYIIFTYHLRINICECIFPDFFQFEDIENMVEEDVQVNTGLNKDVYSQYVPRKKNKQV